MASLAKLVATISHRNPRWYRDFHTKITGERIHVAAVCYRLKDDEPEFLLVRTRSGRWTFPKGGVDGDATHAEAAAREAFEEAGVKGQVEQEPFHWYFHSKRQRFKSHSSVVAVQAHLCEVRRQQRPHEGYRNPTWFKAEKARRRLKENRSPDLAGEILEVLDLAVQRIRIRTSRVA
jgi:8-oxo-dGTP pyrophosphatase MutT (NUDIX family)